MRPDRKNNLLAENNLLAVAAKTVTCAWQISVFTTLADY